MCGFSGELCPRGPADVTAVAAMAATMSDRGPDGAGVYAQGGVALAHRRLKIIDLSEKAAQPLVDPELGLTIAFNGCIYNYPELRRELQDAGYTFFSEGDTEVILKAWHRWGEAAVTRLQGMFAFCIVERDSGRAILARDRLGIKPLYLAEGPNDSLRFASTIPALIAGGGIDTDIDPVALQHYLSFHAVVPAPRTMFRGIRKLEPATVMIVEPDGRRRTTKYWEPAHVRSDLHIGWTDNDWQDAILDALRLAVRRRLVADVPVGVLLSGGLDSSLIVGLLAEQGQTGLNTFSVGFDTVEDVGGDEFVYSDLVAERFETDHHQIRVGADGMVAALPDVFAAMSEPMVSHDCVGFYLLSREVAKTIKVVQSGQGADEIFAGYHWYPPLVDVDGAGGNGSDEYLLAFADRDHAGVNDLISPEYRIPDAVAADFVREHFGRGGATSPVDRALRLDTQVMLVEDPVKRVDNMTMAWGLEARVPFLDHELVELAAACPPHLKLAQGGKGVLKEVARRIIPHDNIDRPKGYFPVPAITHVRGPVLGLVRDALHAPAAKARGLYNPEHVDRLLAMAERGESELTPLRGNTLWQLGVLELWLQGQGI